MKKSSDTIGNRNRDLPACNAVPQSTAPRRAPSRALDILQTIAQHEYPFSPSVCRRRTFFIQKLLN